MEDKNQNYWSMYIGQSLTDPDIAPATVIVTETFHKSLLSGNPGAWKIFVKESAKFIEERESNEGPIY